MADDIVDGRLFQRGGEYSMERGAQKMRGIGPIFCCQRRPTPPFQNNLPETSTVLERNQKTKKI
jgi:hypothetical protein